MYQWLSIFKTSRKTSRRPPVRPPVWVDESYFKICAEIVRKMAPYEGWKFGGLIFISYLCIVIVEMR